MVISPLIPNIGLQSFRLTEDFFETEQSLPDFEREVPEVLLEFSLNRCFKNLLPVQGNRVHSVGI
jgi:hypothetical protein